MRPNHPLCLCLCLFLFVLLASAVPHPARAADAFTEFVKPLLSANCQHCHGPDEANAKIDFDALGTSEHLLQRPQLIEDVIKVIDTNDMPPEGEPALDDRPRSRLITTLKTMLREATSDLANVPVPIRT